MLYSCERLGFGNIYVVFWRLSFLSSLPDKLSFLLRVLIFANFNCKKISWVWIFANLTSRNISRVFKFAKIAKKSKIREKNVPAKISTPKVSPFLQEQFSPSFDKTGKLPFSALYFPKCFYLEYAQYKNPPRKYRQSIN